MTYTEAAVEILRRAGKPLHFKEIAAEAVNAGLLSHVGQTPEETMGTRLLSMSRREHDRKVVTLETGVFALAEWGLPVPAAVEAPVLAPVLDENEPQYRPRERHPPMQPEVLVGGRRDDRRRRDEDEGQRRKRYGPPADAAWQWLRERGEPATLAEVAQALREKDRIAEALERDLQSFEKALREENRRRQDGRRSPIFEFGEGGIVRALEIPKEQPRAEKQRPQERPRREEAPRPVAGFEEQRRQVLRSVRRRLGSLDGAALERVCVALLEAQGYRELNMARRGAKEGPLYLARRKWGAGEIRYVVRVLRPGREVGRPEVQDVRRDLSHYSGQIGVVFGSGECTRESKSESNIPNQAPVMVYGGEALAEALVDAGLGATKRLVEWLDYDDEFFASMGAGEALPEVEGIPPPVEPAAEAPASEGGQPQDRGQRGRDRRRPQRRRDGPRPQPGASEGAESPAGEAGPAPEATGQEASAEPAAEAAEAPLPAGGPGLEPVAVEAPPAMAAEPASEAASAIEAPSPSGDRVEP